jgi:hypothetical protein
MSASLIAVLAEPVFRPDSAAFPLFVHIVGATVMVGGVLTSGSALAFAKGDAKLLRLGYWSMLAVALPGYIIMRVGAEWLYVEENWDEVPDRLLPSWLEIGFWIANVGALLLVIALVVGGIGMRQLRQGKGEGLFKVTMVLAFVILAAAVVAAWAMAGKPT